MDLNEAYKCILSISCLHIYFLLIFIPVQRNVHNFYVTESVILSFWENNTRVWRVARMMDEEWLRKNITWSYLATIEHEIPEFRVCDVSVANK